MNYKEFLEENKKRNKEILELRNKGVSYVKIGKIFGISKQRVEQIVLALRAMTIDK
jgi:hypothetical protein